MPQPRMRMRPWLEMEIDSNKIPGLVWIDKEKKLFQIPWKHAAKHGWDLEKDACLFRNWAIHTGRYKKGEVEPDPKTWKANFRCAMNSLPDIEEVKDKSISKGSTAVRVYRMLPPSAKSLKKGIPLKHFGSRKRKKWSGRSQKKPKGRLRSLPSSCQASAPPQTTREGGERTTHRRSRQQKHIPQAAKYWEALLSSNEGGTSQSSATTLQNEWHSPNQLSSTKSVDEIKTEETVEATNSIQLTDDHSSYARPSYSQEAMEAEDASITLALSACDTTSSLTDWRPPLDVQLPDSTNDIYSFQVSPITSSSDATDEDNDIFYEQLLNTPDNWHQTTIGGKGFFSNEPGVPNIYLAFGFQDQDTTLDPTCSDTVQNDSKTILDFTLLESLRTTNLQPISCGM